MSNLFDQVRHFSSRRHRSVPEACFVCGAGERDGVFYNDGMDNSGQHPWVCVPCLENAGEEVLVAILTRQLLAMPLLAWQDDLVGELIAAGAARSAMRNDLCVQCARPQEMCSCNQAPLNCNPDLVAFAPLADAEKRRLIAYCAYRRLADGLLTETDCTDSMDGQDVALRVYVIARERGHISHDAQVTFLEHVRQAAAD